MRINAGVLFLARPVIFVDTSAWVAIRLGEDRHHHAASEAWSQVVSAGHALCTTNLVVGETYTWLRRRRGYAAAWTFVDWLAGARRVRRPHVTPELEAQAYTILRQYRDHDFSFVDATSFAFMRAAGLTEAFAFDAHFATAGFIRIPVDRPVG